MLSTPEVNPPCNAGCQENAFGRSSQVRFRKLGMAPEEVAPCSALKLNEVLVTTAPEGHIKVKLLMFAEPEEESETRMRGLKENNAL